jgi:hypothetical protein
MWTQWLSERLKEWAGTSAWVLNERQSGRMTGTRSVEMRAANTGLVLVHGY